MSENLIYCYSGSGNCLDMAKNIAKELGDTEIVMMRSFPVKTDATEAKRVGFIFPCYGGGLPGNVESYVKAIHIGINSYKFAIVQYAGYKGCGLHKIDKIVDLDYWNGMSNHCSCIWLMPHYLTVPPLPRKLSQKRSEAMAKKFAADIKATKRSEKKPPKGTVFALESKLLSSQNTKRIKKFTVNENCVSCGQCAKICPQGNITYSDARPAFGTNCIGCLSCVQYCPSKAINIGSITKHRARYHNANITAEELTEKTFHIE
ncbi:MAG: EFR1 family ferrodoxin [Eubacteriales bacterium]|jgi:formate hydrogenlyase subunit 6/NADH:ubiquinone oxidoreductase subunit I|nr:EFR1 family ferrodoxin [Eubacteriales bacterium]